MMLHDLTHEDGSRTIQIRTGCGYEITLMRSVERVLRQTCYFDGIPVSFMNARYVLSEIGACEYADAIKELFK